MLKKQNIVMVLTSIFLIFAGFVVGRYIALPTPRVVKTTKMESCLKFYIEYRKTTDQKALKENLKNINLTPLDFQKIIDRFIYYRSRKSHMKHAMKLLEAFRLGYDIKPTDVFSVSDVASESFRLDAEILAVFDERPDLIKQAFEG